MAELIRYLSYYCIPLLWFVLVPGVAAAFLAIGVRDHRDSRIPGGWWALMVGTFASPVVILAIASAFAGDPVEGKARSGAGLLLGAITIAGIASPILLGAATLHLSDRRDKTWRSASAIACLSIVPGTLLAVLGAAQVLSGVSL